MNPVVSAELANQIKASFPEIPVYPEAGGQVKLAAGWFN
jgi:UDP-N-acetylmuramate dehydrogenase